MRFIDRMLRRLWCLVRGHRHVWVCTRSSGWLGGPSDLRRQYCLRCGHARPWEQA